MTDLFGSINFEEVWEMYPVKVGKKAALRHFKSSIKTAKDMEMIKIALTNYCKSARVKAGYVQNAGTWFNSWKDWIVNPEIKVTKEQSIQAGNDLKDKVEQWKLEAVPPPPETVEAFRKLGIRLGSSR